MPSTPSAFIVGKVFLSPSLVSKALALDFNVDLIPCLTASFAPKPTAVPEPKVKAPAITDNKLVGSERPAKA